MNMTALLEVSGVSVSFDGFRAINNLSFSIGAAEMRAVIGPNGAGKTTFMDIVTGKTKPDSGSVTFGERSVSLLSKSEAQIAQIGIGRKFQRPTVFEDQTTEENLRLALKANRAPWAVLFSRGSAIDRERIESLAAQVGLTDALHRRAGEVTCILGTNGVGKTSLLKALSGTHARSAGTLDIAGAPLPTPARADTIARAGLGYVPT